MVPRTTTSPLLALDQNRFFIVCPPQFGAAASFMTPLIRRRTATVEIDMPDYAPVRFQTAATDPRDFYIRGDVTLGREQQK
jgi:hypothetical protein